MSTKRIILFSILGIFLILIGYVAYTLLTTKSHSPADVAKYDNNGLSIQVEYCRPFKKGRLIFGPEEDGALQPYGKYWRVGANEATKIIVNKPINIGGNELAAGEYSIYAFPGQSEWEIGIHPEWDRWGAFEPDYANELFRFKVPASNDMIETEQFTITFEEGDQVETNMVLRWDKTLVAIPIN